jgi:hypothetical protein
MIPSPMQNLLWELSHGWTLRYQKPARGALPGWDMVRNGEQRIVAGAAARWLVARELVERIPETEEFRLTDKGHAANLTGSLGGLS